MSSTRQETVDALNWFHRELVPFTDEKEANYVRNISNAMQVKIASLEAQEHIEKKVAS